MTDFATTHRWLPENGRSEVIQSQRTYDCVHRIFEQQATKSPDRVALVSGNLTLTYEQLNQKANHVAHQLLALGVEPETLVGISIPRSTEQIINILGILKAGCAYLPLDPDCPHDRLKAIIEDAKVKFLLTSSSLVERFPKNHLKIICADIEPTEKVNSENPVNAINANNLAYVMFTSGSTGRPKGVMIEHRSIVRLVKGADYADFSSENVFLQFAPITFDASTFEIWGALLNGGRLAIMPEERASLVDLGNAIREYGVTTLWLTAGLFHLMVDERIEDLKPLRQLVAGGDVLSVAHVQKVLNNLSCDLINGYGPTENTTFTCCYKVPRTVRVGRSIPIGKPIGHTQVYILNESLNPVMPGEAGELYIGGDGLARGYVNQDDLTAERFVSNPYSESPSSRLYRSGDMARFLPDGNIEFLGRADRQVKIRGFRVELDEIEFALTQQAGVREAVAVAREISGIDKQLVAFVVLDPCDPPLICELRKHLEGTLPGYMIPSFVIQIDVIPLTPNGKVDRAMLIRKIGSEPNRQSSIGKPETRTESTIAQILEEVLGRDSVGVNDNFFDIGADSLQLARFHSRLQATFNSNLKIVSLFQNPSVRSLARSFGHDSSLETTLSGRRDRANRQREAYAKQRRMQSGRN